MPKPKLSIFDDMPPDHAFFGHPVIHEFGDKLAGDALREIGRHVDVNGAFDRAHQAFTAIQEAERGNEPLLTDLARSVVETVWGIPPDQLKGGIGSVEGDVGGMDFGGGESGEPKTLWDLDPSQVSEVQKRLLINTIIQGCAIHAMLNNPRMVQGDLNKISPNLIELYEQFAWNALAMYWSMDYESMTPGQMSAQAAGYEEVKYEQREEQEVPVVYAKGLNFPVMLQEFVKGVAEVVCMESFAHLDPDVQSNVIELADKVEYEPYEIMIGPQIWRKLLKRISREETPADYLLRLSRMAPDDLMEFVAEAITEKPDADVNPPGSFNEVTYVDGSNEFHVHVDVETHEPVRIYGYADQVGEDHEDVWFYEKGNWKPSEHNSLFAVFTGDLKKAYNLLKRHMVRVGG